MPRRARSSGTRSQSTSGSSRSRGACAHSGEPPSRRSTSRPAKPRARTRTTARARGPGSARQPREAGNPPQPSPTYTWTRDGVDSFALARQPGIRSCGDRRPARRRMESPRYRAARARSCKRRRVAPGRRRAVRPTRRGHPRFGPQWPGQDRRADRRGAGADRAPPVVCDGVGPREKGQTVTTIDTHYFRTMLLEERERVQKAIANLRDDHPGSLDEEVEEIAATSDNHLGETASATLGREIDYTLGEHSEHLLSEVEAALVRVEDGTYGVCVKCGGTIPPERLEAPPWASLCIDDARLAERG